MYIIKRISGFFFTVYAFLVFVILMFILLPFIVIASFFGKIKGGNIIYKICSLWADIAMLCWGMYHRNHYNKTYNLNTPAIYVFNHISYMDIPILMKTFRKMHVRILGKAEMTKIPIFGFIYKNAVVAVNRTSPAHRAKSVNNLKKVLGKNISVVIAPEGTFNMTHHPLKEFYDGAFRIAIETQTPIRPVILLDAFDRMHHKSVFTMSPGKSRSIFLDEINVAGLTPGDLPLLKQKVYDIMETKLRNEKASWIKDGIS